MENKIIVRGTQEFIGIDIPVIEGGFGNGCKCITDKTISEIHEMKIIHIRELINRNAKRFKDGIDYIDLKKVIDQNDNNLLSNLDYTTMQISKSSKHFSSVRAWLLKNN